MAKKVTITIYIADGPVNIPDLDRDVRGFVVDQLETSLEDAVNGVPGKAHYERNKHCVDFETE